MCVKKPSIIVTLHIMLLFSKPSKVSCSQVEIEEQFMVSNVQKRTFFQVSKVAARTPVSLLIETPNACLRVCSSGLSVSLWCCLAGGPDTQHHLSMPARSFEGWLIKCRSMGTHPQRGVDQVSPASGRGKEKQPCLNIVRVLSFLPFLEAMCDPIWLDG